MEVKNKLGRLSLAFSILSYALGILRNLGMDSAMVLAIRGLVLGVAFGLLLAIPIVKK